MLMHADNGGVDHLDGRIMSGGECIDNIPGLALGTKQISTYNPL
jgi:hypothetical protein